jgi:hypothetical protein
MMRFVLAVLNLLGFPGIGTWLAGHKRTGIIQLLLHVIGMGLTLGGFCCVAPIFLPYFKSAEGFRDYLENGLPGGFGPVLLPLTISFIGVIIFLSNWLWSATTTKPANEGKTPPPLPREPRH